MRFFCPACERRFRVPLLRQKGPFRCPGCGKLVRLTFQFSHRLFPYYLRSKN